MSRPAELWTPALATQENKPDTLEWGNRSLACSSADQFPAYLPRVTLPAKFVETVRRIGGDSLIAACGYGSAFNGEGLQDSRTDMLIVVSDPLIFHKQNINNGILRYGGNKNPEFHTQMNRTGLNFYPGVMDWGEGDARIKVGVCGFDVFQKHLSGGGLDGVLGGKGQEYLPLGGRFHKARVVPIITRFEGAQEEEFNTALNQDRWWGYQLALARVPDRFSVHQLGEELVNLSYLGDVRVEKPKKHKKIFEKSKADYQSMMATFLRELSEKGFIEAGDGGYRKLKSLSGDSVTWWLWQAKPYAAKVNYVKNWQTFGLRDGVKYAMEKVARSFKSALLAAG